jgi:hypothetical protein
LISPTTLTRRLPFIRQWEPEEVDTSETFERGVHLFRGGILFANLTTTAAHPDDSYIIDGVDYEVDSVAGPYPDGTGSEGWIVQVARTRRWV